MHNPERRPRQAVAFFTHVFDPSVARRYRKLKAELSNQAQLFILAQAGTAIPDEFADDTYYFDYDKLRAAAATAIGDRLIPGNIHFVTLDFFRNNPVFDFYWFIEYDVVFTGNWAVLINAVRNDESDLLASHVRSYPEEPEWPWWSSLSLPDCSLKQSDWLRGFFPVFRISSAALAIVDEHVKKGWSGHYEGLVPCIIRSASLSIADLGGAGQWTPKERRNLFYSSFSSHAGKYLDAGTHRHRPSHFFPRLRRNTIFHPVKHDSILGSSQWCMRILRRARAYWSKVFI